MRDGSTRSRCLPFANEATSHVGCGAQSALICMLRTGFEVDLQQTSIFSQRLMRLFGNNHPVMPIANGILHALNRFRHGLGRGILVIRLGYVASLLRTLAEVMQILLIQQRHCVHQPQVILKRKAHSRPMSAHEDGAAFCNFNRELLFGIEQSIRVIVEGGAKRIGSGGATRFQPGIQRTRLFHERCYPNRTGGCCPSRFGEVCSHLVGCSIGRRKKVVREQLTVHIQIANGAGRAAHLLQLAQPLLAGRFRRFAQSACTGLSGQRLERGFDATRASSQMMDLFDLWRRAALATGIEFLTHFGCDGAQMR